MTREEQQYILSYDPIVEAIRILARRGRELREAPRNAAYEGMTRDELRVAVYEKYKRGELHPSEMTVLERKAWDDEISRQIAELRHDVEQRRRDVELLGNAVWNSEHHSMLVNRISDKIWDKLTEEERRAFLELLESCHWGPAEVARAKEIVETAEWFSKLESR